MAVKKPVKYKFPAPLGACLSRLAALQKQAELLDAKSMPVTAEASALREHLLGTFKKDELQGAKGAGLSLAIVKSTVPTMEDFKVFLKFAMKKGNEDLLQNSVNTPAWRERVAEGIHVPGVGTYDRVTLRVTKSDGK